MSIRRVRSSFRQFSSEGTRHSTGSPKRVTFRSGRMRGFARFHFRRLTLRKRRIVNGNACYVKLGYTKYINTISFLDLLKVEDLQFKLTYLMWTTTSCVCLTDTLKPLGSNVRSDVAKGRTDSRLRTVTHIAFPRIQRMRFTCVLTSEREKNRRLG